MLGAKTQQAGFNQARSVFLAVAQRVPAYKDFLKKHKINPTKVKTLPDFENLPIVTKENYLQKYPLKALLWDGKIADSRVISVSSGSSGEPFFWFRGSQSVKDSLTILEETVGKTFNTRSKKTLVVNAFAQGTWIAGTYMFSAMLGLADKGHKIVTINPGINKTEIIKILAKIGGQFEQTVIMGYPPFIKDVIDAALNENLNLKKYYLGLIFAGENFSEKFRDYLLAKIGKKDDINASLSIYGTADAGIIGMESPVSVFVRRLAAKNQKILSTLFPGAGTLPTFVQYNPKIRFLESVEGKIIFTVNNSLPLIRYGIKDEGRLIAFREIVKILENNKTVLPKWAKVYPPLPFVALYGRPDVATMFYGLNIYPENIKHGLEQKNLAKYVTGKFIAKTQSDDKTQEQSLHIDVELKMGIRSNEKIKKAVFAAVFADLKKLNSEFNKLNQDIGIMAEPHIHLISFDQPQFQINIKHRWVVKE